MKALLAQLKHCLQEAYQSCIDIRDLWRRNQKFQIILYTGTFMQQVAYNATHCNPALVVFGFFAFELQRRKAILKIGK